MFVLQRPVSSINLENNRFKHDAGMAELADAADSKSADLRVLGVRLPLPAPLWCLTMAWKSTVIRPHKHHTDHKPSNKGSEKTLAKRGLEICLWFFSHIFKIIASTRLPLAAYV